MYGNRYVVTAGRRTGGASRAAGTSRTARTYGKTGNGASQTAQLTDWQFRRVDPTHLQFGASCLPSMPCNVSLGGTVKQFTDGPTT